MKIKTNHKFRDLLSHWDLTPKELEEFDYIEAMRESGVNRFFRYRGCVYDAGEFTVVEKGGELKAAGWHAYLSDSYFSGILIRYSGDFESVKVGAYFS